MPFEIVSLLNEPKFTPDEVRSILAFVREHAIKSGAPADRPRLSTDIQPWVIQQVSRWSGNEVQVWLKDPAGRRIQQIRMRMDVSGLTLLELH